jgi:hypothetical protein
VKETRPDYTTNTTIRIDVTPSRLQKEVRLPAGVRGSMKGDDAAVLQWAWVWATKTRRRRRLVKSYFCVGADAVLFFLRDL